VLALYRLDGQYKNTCERIDTTIKVGFALLIEKRWLALDLDGTLLEPGSIILPQAMQLLDRYVAHGGKIVIATGRTLGSIMEILEKNACGLDGSYPHAIVANEREVYRKAKNGFVSVEPRNQELIAREHALIDQARSIADQAQEILSKRNIECRLPDEVLENRRGFIERRYESADEAAVAEEVILSLIPQQLPLRTVTNNSLVAVRHMDASKGRALMDLCQLEGIAAADLYAVGDACNDRDMLDGSWGFSGGTVANAVHSIRDVVSARGGAIASAVRGLGVAELVEQLLVG
jgi:HAD superfamily hydrolase (TIGR01484 family)